MNKHLQITKYLLCDLFSASAAWVLFWFYRKKYLESVKYGYEIPVQLDENFYIGLAAIPLGWLALYSILGHYNDIYRKHRLKELGQTLTGSLIGTIVLFFAIVLNDEVASYRYYYNSLASLFLLHFSLTFTLRFAITNRTVKRLHRRKFGFKTLVVGGNQEAVDMVKEIDNIKNYPGFKFVGYVSMNGNDRMLSQLNIPYMGKYTQVEDLVREKNIEEVIIAIESSEHKNLGSIITSLEGLNVKIKVIPDTYDILSGSVKMTSIWGTPLIQINPEIMPAWQLSIKRLMDLFVSIAALIFLFPVYFTLAVLVRLSGPGPVIFRQQRIGQHGRPFYIYKFRSMVVDAESTGPQLSSTHDNRITPVGRFMRKSRLDELPQFFNVVKGDMSLVGPRPERQFYIDQIMLRAPHYRYLHKVKPGITSWGQVKYGYAENVDQMIQRLKYDILYIENMSIAVDLKILAYTLLTVLKGSGK